MAIIGGAIGQLFMKAGMQYISIASPTSFLTSMQAYPSATIFVAAGILAYLCSMMIWVYCLKNTKLSVAYPLLSLSYVLVYIGAALWPTINEAMTLQKTVGIALILFGVWFSTVPLNAKD